MSLGLIKVICIQFMRSSNVLLFFAYISLGGIKMSDQYIVQEGDTLIKIAALYNIPVDVLIRANHNLQLGKSLVTGEVLLIPNVAPLPFGYYTVLKGDTLYQVATKYQINPDLLANINGLEPKEYIYPGMKLLVPKKGVVMYITKPGDTIESISDFYGAYPEELIIYNHNIYLLPDQLIAFKTHIPDKNA